MSGAVEGYRTTFGDKGSNDMGIGRVKRGLRVSGSNIGRAVAARVRLMDAAGPQGSQQLNKISYLMYPGTFFMILWLVLIAFPRHVAAFDVDEYPDQINLGYAGAGFERQNLGERLLRELAEQMAGSQPYILATPIRADAWLDDDVTESTSSGAEII